eukprot:CAMPEP_0117577534 /NCGR_PEP_ID=MMETSP0784-20121206/63473_1 /TAXON_ID=39447 /ORGANISM="" /LENGTH=196 /DNA_ID=CAMNT_0005377041 /DNA_START=89 /DNA_END=679 /DNA_ORIENTATION=-
MAAKTAMATPAVIAAHATIGDALSSTWPEAGSATAALAAVSADGASLRLVSALSSTRPKAGSATVALAAVSASGASLRLASVRPRVHGNVPGQGSPQHQFSMTDIVFCTAGAGTGTIPFVQETSHGLQAAKHSTKSLLQLDLSGAWPQQASCPRQHVSEHEVAPPKNENVPDDWGGLLSSHSVSGNVSPLHHPGPQ